jgi:hypothetical protein
MAGRNLQEALDLKCVTVKYVLEVSLLKSVINEVMTRQGSGLSNAVLLLEELAITLPARSRKERN